MHPAKSTVEYLKNINFQGLIYIIASDAFKSVLKKEGFQLKDGVCKLNNLNVITINYLFHYLYF